ncbi:MAG: hypothetical protein RL701_7672 [Pseudomonadota bacterium]
MQDSPDALTRARVALATAAHTLGLQPLPEAAIDSVYLPLAAALAASAQGAKHCHVIGLSGAQGTGKSTLAHLLQAVLEHAWGLRTVVLSLDDYYLPKLERQRLAHNVHPLLATRGAPGTHEVVALDRALQALRHATENSQIELLRFSKAHDDRSATTDTHRGACDMILFEGWCVGARRELTENLLTPINELERDEDRSGAFRAYVNAQLVGPYAKLWQQLDRLCFLSVADMSQVIALRSEQEQQLLKRHSDAPSSMNHAQLVRFIQHFERVTRHMLHTTPDYADVVIRIAADRSLAITANRIASRT